MPDPCRAFAFGPGVHRKTGGFGRACTHKGRLEAVLPKIAWPKLSVQAIYPNRNQLPAKVRSFLDYLAGPNGLTAAMAQFDEP